MDDFLSSAQCPQDAKLIVLILRSMGVTQFEPAVVLQLLEFTHRASPPSPCPPLARCACVFLCSVSQAGLQTGLQTGHRRIGGAVATL